MANTAKFKAGTYPPTAQRSVLGAELNSLGSGSASAASSAIGNDANLDMFANFMLHLASLSPVAGAHIDLYILVSYDNTNYPSATGSVLRNQPNQLLCSIPIDTTAATAQDIPIRGVPLPPNKFKIVADNQAGVALNASGNTLVMETYNVDLNG